MFSLSTVQLVTTPVDGRMGIDRLSQWLQNVVGGTPCDGAVYAFVNRRRTRLKLLCWDGTGVWLAQRRLHRGVFVWPRAGETHITLNETQWQWLFAGVDWQRSSVKVPPNWRV